MPDEDKPTAQPNSDLGPQQDVDLGPQQDVDLSAFVTEGIDDSEIETRVASTEGNGD